MLWKKNLRENLEIFGEVVVQVELGGIACQRGPLGSSGPRGRSIHETGVKVSVESREHLKDTNF